jgi:putative DNA methylase
LSSKHETRCSRLIEVALPIREISAESVRDKQLRFSHISNLHGWWARRPLAASRAVVFASLVPDPDDPSCPTEFRSAVSGYLKTDVPPELRHYLRGRTLVADPDPYRPYDGIPDTLRNRLLAFIAKWSSEAIEFEQGRSSTKPKPEHLLDDRSLSKWESSDPENPQGRKVLDIARSLIAIANINGLPTIADPFAGGGAIPLEALRLGCHVIASDYNPVAYLILRATCEFPQQYGKPGRRTVASEEFGKRKERQQEIPNVLAHDFEKWAHWVLNRSREKLSSLYPPGKDGRTVLGYLWARTVQCSNPSCRRTIPLLRTLVLSAKDDRKIALSIMPDEARNEVRFGIARGADIKRTEGTKRERGPATCPYPSCGQPTSEEDLRRAGQAGLIGERMIAVMVQGDSRRDYRPVERSDLEAFDNLPAVASDSPGEYIVPEINAPTADVDSGSHRSINLELYGFTRWGQLFNRRQLAVMRSFVEGVQEAEKTMRGEIDDRDYRLALAIYLGLWADRVAAFGNGMCRWVPGGEFIATPFSGQSIPMMWDYPEVNPFGNSGSGTAVTQLEYMLKVIRHESDSKSSATPIINLASAASIPVEDSSCTCVITDPPYGNSIAYADLSDFFYVWLKRSLGDLLPEIFVTPQTPKVQEATSHKHRHHGSQAKANDHYQSLLTRSFLECGRIMKQPKILSVMFAHQSSDAWTALLRALFDAGFCPDATWPIATERPTSALGLGTASLETSVTVVCRPRVAGSTALFRDVTKEIQGAVREAIDRFWGYGLRGADLIVTCYGPAVGVFGKYERVEKKDGTPVDIPELLDIARAAARDAIAGEFRADNLSTLYYVWVNMYGVAEQAWDDARLVVQIGGDAESAMEVAKGHGIFVVEGSKCRLSLLADRSHRRQLGRDADAPLIDCLHQAMLLWKQEKREQLVQYLIERDLLADDRFWKLAQSLFDVLPHEIEDWKVVSALLGERDTLRAESKKATETSAQRTLGLR